MKKKRRNFMLMRMTDHSDARVQIQKMNKSVAEICKEEIMSFEQVI